MNAIRYQWWMGARAMVIGLICGLIGCALATETLSAAEKKASTQSDKAKGRLVIKRAANLGPTIVGLKIDGAQTDQISYNRTYNAPIAAGSHVLTVYPVVSREGAKPTETRVNVEAGKTYTFTAAREDIQIVLK